MLRPRLLALLALCGFASARAEDLAIVVAHAVPIENLTLEELRAVFLMEKAVVNGTKLSILMREKTAPERAAILKSVYQMSKTQYEAYFLQATFTGLISAGPRLIPSSMALKKIVVGSPGAIGYVVASAVDASVKVVKIDGRSPGDPQYPLKL
ncbi:MAG: hypothetical protein RLZZ15_2989 [Verrucomicrobiota bacterium]|jgi:uncharacterized membrane protein